MNLVRIYQEYQVPIFFAILFSLTSIWATVFSIQPIERQLKEADAIIEGFFLGEQTVELENGKLATKMTFKINKEWGLKSHLFEMDEVFIHYPGGKLGDRQVMFQGVPNFVTGERVVILAKNLDNRFWGLNLGLGSFKVVSFNHIPVLMNSLFPGDRRVSQISLDDFETTVREIKSESPKSPRLDHIETDSQLGRIPASIEREKSRTLASTRHSRENNEDQSNLGIFWLIALFAILGGVTKIIRERKA
jgi:hypothetical protein